MSDAQNESKKRKFRHTRELVKIARDAGMTQEEIAKRCRVQQSTVSNWQTGKTKATEEQLKPLLDRFGSRLRRASSRTYLLEPQSSQKRPPIDMRVVQGRVIFRHVFVAPRLRPDIGGRDISDVAKKRPMRTLQFVANSRWIIHEVAASHFVLVRQTRREWSPQTAQQWLQAFGNPLRDLADSELSLDPWLRCADDSARWYSTIDDPRSVGALLDFVDKYAFDNEDDALTVRFLIRKALHEHGHTIPGLANPATLE